MKTNQRLGIALAYAQQSGLYVGLLGFAAALLYLRAAALPVLSLLSVAVATVSLVVASRSIGYYRATFCPDRGALVYVWLFAMCIFLFGSVLVATGMWAYFTFFDNGFFLSTMSQALADPASADMLRGTGLTSKQVLAVYSALRPIELAIMWSFLAAIGGVVVSLPLALLNLKKR